MAKVITPQSTIDSCLSICLMTLLRQKGIDVPASEEMNMLVEGLKFTKFDYSTGHVAYVSAKYDVGIEQYVDFPGFFFLLSKYHYPPKMKLISQIINLRLITKLLKSSPLIIYVNQYFLGGGLHASHFVILEKLDAFATIVDPWDGERKKIPTPIFLKSIKSLRTYLKISPKIIRII